MKNHILWIIAAGAALAGSGCANHHPATAADGQAVFGALQRAVAAAGKQVEPGLAVVKVQAGSAASSRPLAGLNILGADLAGSSPSSGITLTTNGYILVPGIIKPDQDNRITVLIGENEFVARAVKADETLGMSIIKVDSDEDFTPLDISRGADLAVGEWALVVKPTDEESDYQKLSTLSVCQGERAGRYRRFLLNTSLGSAGGAVVVNLAGKIVGLVDRGGVLAINDVREDLQRLLADATGVTSPESDQQKKGWFGAMLDPVNKDYAKARKLSPSSLLVLHAVQNGPAASAGLQEGDLIIALNGKPLRLTGNRALEYFSKSLHPRNGEKFNLTVLRSGKPVELSGTFTKPPEPETLRAEDLGVTIAGITDSEVFSQNLATDGGVLVTDVDRGSPAANSGTLRQTLIARRDIIVELAGQPTPTVAAFSKVLESIRQDHPPVVLVKYYRGLLTGYAGLNLALGEKDNGNKQ